MIRKKTLDVNKKLYDHELESAVLGAIILENDCLKEIIEIFSPEVFEKKENKIVAQAVMDLNIKSKPIDLLTVVTQIKDNGCLNDCGGAYYVSTLTTRIASGTNIYVHYKVLQQLYLERFLLNVTNETKNRIFTYGNDVFDVYNWLQSTVEKGLTKMEHKKMQTIKDVHEEILVEAIKVNETGERTGVPSGYKLVDNTTCGWQKQDLIIYAGRASMGKTAGALNFVYNAAVKNKKPVAVFSLEMSNKAMIGRLQSIASGINAGKIIKKQLTKEEIAYLYKSCEELANSPIYIDDTPAISLPEFRAKAKKMVEENGVELIVVDYLQLMRSGMNIQVREQEVSEISRGLKRIARELDVPIIALSQLSRATESGSASKKPMLSHLRESGAIEQDADMVLFAFRPEYYGMQEYELNDNIVPANNLYIIIFAKNRNGALGEIPLTFYNEQMKLEDYDVFSNGNTIYSQDFKKNNENNFESSQKINTFVNEEKVETITNNIDFLSQGKAEDAF